MLGGAHAQRYINSKRSTETHIARYGALRWLVLTLPFAAHLICVNLAMAGPILCAWLDWRAGRRADPMAGRVARQLAFASLIALILGLAFGGMLLLFDRGYTQAAAALPAWWLWQALGEILFSLVCLAVYWRLTKDGRLRSWLLRLLPILAATDLMMHFPPLFAMFSLIASRAEFAHLTLDRHTYHQLLANPEVLSRVAHVWLASLAVAGMAVIVCARRSGTQHDPAAEQLVARGGWAALVPTLFQVPAGLWLFMQLPAQARDGLLGDDPLGMILLLAGVLTAIYLMHQLATISLGDTRPAQVRRTALIMAVNIFLMVATLQRVHLLTLTQETLPAASER